MPQSLVETRAHEDVRLHLTTRQAIIHDLIAIGLQTQVITEHLGHSIQGHLRIKWRAISQTARMTANLAEQCLHELSNSHARWNTMRIDNDIRDDTRSSLRHILRLEDHSDCSLLAVATGELVSDLGSSEFPHPDFHERIPLAISVLEDLVNKSTLIVSRCPADIPVFLGPRGQNHSSGNA